MTNPFEVIINEIQRLHNRLDTIPAKSPLPEIIDRKTLASRLNITCRSVINLEDKKKLPVMRMGGIIRYNWPDVVEHLRKINYGK